MRKKTPKQPPGAATGYNYPGVDYRAHPACYYVGRGEQGVLTVEPYKSELLPLWRFRTPEIARESAEALWARFLAYQAEGDFVGMDMARKFLQMGYTRARRYANHRGGRKYGADGHELPRELDEVKAEAARVFYPYWRRAADDPGYQAARAEHQARQPSAAPAAGSSACPGTPRPSPGGRSPASPRRASPRTTR
jgi:hypothetical protein